MPALRIVYDVDGWAYHNRALALAKHAPCDFEVTIAPAYTHGGAPDLETALGAEPVDVLLLLDVTLVGACRRLLRARQPKPVLVASWNVGWPNRIPLFHIALNETDCLLVNNREYWDRVGRPRRTRCHPNGVDLDVFNVQTPISERRARVLWLGSEHNQAVKGYGDILLPLRELLDDRGIEHDFLLVDSHGESKRAPAEMARWYNTGTIVVVASFAEGTPNIALEGAACGCTVVSTPVGNMPELIEDGANGYLVERNVPAILTAIEAARARYAALASRMQADIESWSWSLRSAEFYSTFRELLATRRHTGKVIAQETIVDLGEEVTIFVDAADHCSAATCLACLREQDCKCRVEILVGESVTGTRLREVVERCSTPYFLRVTDDALLHPWCVRRLYERMCTGDDALAAVRARLLDVHLNLPIHAVGMYRCARVRELLDEDRAADLELGAHLLDHADCPASTSTQDVFGLSGSCDQPERLYRRFRSLCRLGEGSPLGQTERLEVCRALLRRVLENRSRSGLFALIGALSPLLSDEATRAHPAKESGSAATRIVHDFFDDLTSRRDQGFRGD